MDSLKKLEQTLAQWQKKSSIHLPASWQKWLGQNAWWITIVGVILAIASLITSLRVLLWREDVIHTARQFAESLGVAAPHIGPIHTVSLWVSIATAVAVVIIQLQAITLLRKKAKRGWDLLFLALIVDIAGSFIAGILSQSLVGPLFALAIAALLGWFFLFEIRGQFLPKEKTTPSTPQKETTTPSTPKE